MIVPTEVEALPPEKAVQFVGAMHPLKVETCELVMRHGLTIAEMLALAQPDPGLLRDAVVFIDDVEVKREYWHLTRPKPGHVVTARVVPFLRGGGGGGGGGKSPTRTLLTIAVIAAAFFLGPALGAALGFNTSAVILGQTVNLAAAVGGALISVAGTLLVNAIAPIRPPSMATLSGAGVGGVAESPSLFLDGSRNAARPFEVVPSVLGFYRFRPPLGATTFTEVLGDSNRLRMLLAVGLGELELSGWRIGNTPLEDFEDYELETRPGTAADAPLTLYTDQVEQDEFSVSLTQASSWHQRTSGLDADELSVDITFPRGLVSFGSSGGRGSRTIVLEVQYRKVGDVTWLDIPAGFTSTLDASAVVGSEVTFTGAQSAAARHGIGWKTPERAQYEVQIRRTTTDTTSTSIFDSAYWATLRTVTNEDPVQLPVPLAKAALNIRATDQINSLLEELSVLAKSVVANSWNRATMTWDADVASNNPADLFRHVLQGPGKATPVPDDEIDLVKLQEWHEFCEDNGFTFNQVRDFSASVQDTLADIASAGRAGLDNVDGKWSVVIDQPSDITYTHISPRNSSNFEAEKLFDEVPHAWRVRFPNENEDYAQDVRTVYRDGYDVGTATLFEAIEFPGVTNPDHVWKLGRYHGAVAVQRPERWTVTQDFEALVARRGRRVKVTHDVVLVGLASGRIKSMTDTVGDGTGDITSITVDIDLTMETGKTYGLNVRRDVPGDVSLSVPINTVVGTTRTVTPTTAVPAASAPEVGDLFGFGELGQETEDALVLSAEPDTEFSGKIALVPYRGTEVYGADTGVVPTYTPTITAEAFLPAAFIEEVGTDESVLEVGAGDAILVRAEVRVQPIDVNGAYLEVQQRFSGTSEPYYNSDMVQRGKSTARLKGLNTGETWDLRVRWNQENKLPGPWTTVPSVRIIGRSSLPSGLTGATISVFGGQAHIRWNEPSELDVRFGGVVQFRHSSSFADPPWPESTSIGDAANARSLFAALPLKPGTYLARVFDADGNPSATIVSLSTKQASVLQYANVSTIDEAPLFLGTHDGTIVKGTELEMQGTGQFDDIADLDAVANLDYYGGVVATATYSFAGGFDFGVVKRVRLTSRMTTLIDNVLDTIDERTSDMDTWEDFDGTNSSQADLQIWEHHTDDDPAGTPTWSAWNRLDSAEFEARGFEFEARFFSDDPAYDLHASELGVDAEEIV